MTPKEEVTSVQITRHEWEQIVENKEREHTARQLEILLQHLKQIANDNRNKI